MSGIWIGRELKVNKIPGPAFILIMFTFPHMERGSTHHLFKSLTNCIINRARLTLTVNFLWKLYANVFEVPVFQSEWPRRGSASNLLNEMISPFILF